MGPSVQDNNRDLPALQYPPSGPLITLVEQPGTREAGRSWTEPDASTAAITIRYVHVGGRESGRYLDGSVRTFLVQGSAEWSTCEALAAAHCREVVASNSFEGLAAVLNEYDVDSRLEPEMAPPSTHSEDDDQPRWEQIVVMINDSRMVARFAIYDGYELITFRMGDRVASSVFSVYDASDIDCSFASITWPPPTEADRRPVVGLAE
ncbi:MAG: hypothetical protein JWQ43_4156 [Glaciihabitans sp.]|nr:hypothetical protein [Glaciihabitans sp.]